MTRTERINFRLGKQLRADLDRIADEREMSVAEVIRMILSAYVQERK